MIHDRDLPRFEALERPPPAEDGRAAARAQRARRAAMAGELADMAMDLARSAYRRAKAEAAADGFGGADDEGDGGEGGGAAASASPLAAGPGEPGGDAIGALRDALSGALAAGDAAVRGAALPRGSAALVFARLSRVVLQALALEERLAEGEAAAQAAAEAAAQPAYDLEMTPERKAKIQARWALLLSRKDRVVDVVHDALATQHPDVRAELMARALNDRLLEFERFEMLNYTIKANAERLCATLGVTLDWDRWADAPWAVAEADGELEWMVGCGPGP